MHVALTIYLFSLTVSNWTLGSSVVSVERMFEGASSFTGKGVGSWNVAKLKTTYYLLYHTAAFDENLNEWNTANVRNMGYTFYLATKFNQNLSKWQTGKVSNMQGMFQSASNFDRDISNWDMTKVSITESMVSEVLYLFQLSPLI